MAEMMYWHSQAACSGKTTLMYANGKVERKQVNQALEMCRSCPVWDQCLTEAMAEPRDALYGIRASMVPNRWRRLQMQFDRLGSLQCETCNSPLDVRHWADTNACSHCRSRRAVFARGRKHDDELLPVAV